MEKEEYQYGFSDKDVSLFNSGKGLNEDVIRFISKSKGEPEWMLEYRLKAYRYFVDAPLPGFGPDLSNIDFNDFTYFIKPSDKVSNSWEEVPETIKNTFDKSNGNSTKLSLNALFCSGSSTSSNAEAGSPRKSWANLSISSSMNTGLALPARFRFWMILPGIAPM